MAAEPTLDDKVVRIDAAFTAAGIGHAFGGALSLAYYAEPRATIDVDCNVFIAPRQAGRVIDCLTELGANADRTALRAAAARDGSIRVRWGRTPIDLFFSYDPFHRAIKSRIRQVPFGDQMIPILSPEHLVVCKAVFDRRKDWLDIEQILFVTAADLDADEVRHWMQRIVGANDHRATTVTVLLDRIVGR
jgi:hypothetical protein